MNSVVHFEITADDKERAKKFYGGVFGWTFNQMGEDMGNYAIAMTTESDENGPKRRGAINGGLMQKDKTAQHTIITIAVDNLDETLEKVKNAGGKVISGKDEIPGIGFYARIEDTEGNVVSLMEPTAEYKEKAKNL